MHLYCSYQEYLYGREYLTWMHSPKTLCKVTAQPLPSSTLMDSFLSLKEGVNSMKGELSIKFNSVLYAGCLYRPY